MESEHNENKAIFDVTLVAVIVFSIVVVVSQVSIAPDTSKLLRTADLICLGIFATEYLCRWFANTDFIADFYTGGMLYAIGQKLRWMLKPMSIIDIVALVPATRALRTMRIFRLLRLARLLRVFKLARYTSGVAGYAEDFKKRSHEFLVVGIVTAGIIVFAAITIFCVEKPAGNENIQDITDAFWWSIVTLTTVGYGDAYPVTNIGRLVATFLMLTSIGAVGALGGIITSVIMSRIADMKAGRAIKMDFSDHILFCGWTPCARKVARTLESQGILDEHQLVILAEDSAPETLGLYHRGTPTSPNDLDKVDASRAAYAVVFHDFIKQGDPVERRRADRRATLTALHIAATSSHAHIIVELYDDNHLQGFMGSAEQFESEPGSHGPRVEIVQKEGYDAEIILNTIRNAGHTSEMLRDLANFENNQIVTRYLSEVLADDGHSERTVSEVKKALIESDQKATFLGYLDPGSFDPILNPDNQIPVQKDTQLYVIHGTGKTLSDVHRNDCVRASGRGMPELPLTGTVLFLGWNLCARATLDKLLSQTIVENCEQVKIVSEREVGSDAYGECINEDYSSPAVLSRLNWSEVSLALIFFEVNPGENSDDVDTRNVLAAMQAARLTGENARVIVEIHEEKHARLLRTQFSEKVEVTFKERMDADLIANTIINPGRVTGLIREIASLEQNRIVTCPLSHLTNRDSCTVRDVHLSLLESSPPVICLGILRAGETTPTLNPPGAETVTAKDVLYCLQRT